jgi:cytoskeleton protein RodZ
VQDSAGKRLFEGTLSGEKRFPLGQGLKVMAGRPDLVTAAVGAKPPRPLGTIQTIDWQVFSPEVTLPAPAP